MKELMIPVDTLQYAFWVIVVFGIIRIIEVVLGKRILKGPLMYLKAMFYMILAIWMGVLIVLSKITEIEIVLGFTFIFCCIEAVTNFADSLEEGRKI